MRSRRPDDMCKGRRKWRYPTDLLLPSELLGFCLIRWRTIVVSWTVPVGSIYGRTPPGAAADVYVPVRGCLPRTRLEASPALAMVPHNAHEDPPSVTTLHLLAWLARPGKLLTAYRAPHASNVKKILGKKLL